MLFSIDNRGDLHRVNHIPHYDSYLQWRRGILDEEYDAIQDELNRRIEGTEVQTSSWIPGGDWTDTVYDPIYKKACNYDHTTSGLFFGLLVWVAFMNHPEDWSFGKYKLNDTPIQGLTYFRINR